MMNEKTNKISKVRNVVIISLCLVMLIGSTITVFANEKGYAGDAIPKPINHSLTITNKGFANDVVVNEKGYVGDMTATSINRTLTSDDKGFANDTIIDKAVDKLKIKKGENHYINPKKRPTFDEKKKRVVVNSIKKSMNKY